MFKDYDNADLGITALFCIGIMAIAWGYVEQGIMGMIVSAIAGISRSNGKPPGGPDTPK
jgi:hypothetical protein